MSFKIGDRVMVKDKFDGLDLKGKKGTIIGKKRLFDWAVEFDEAFVCGHDANGKGKDGHCRYGFSNELELIKKKSEFKKGDRVRIISKGGNGVLHNHFDIGDEVVIESIASNGNYYCQRGTGLEQYVHPSCIELIKKSKFKVGDKVIGNEKASRRYGITKSGWKGIVVNVRETGGIDVKGKGLSAFDCVFDNLKEDCFDLYKEEKGKGWRIEIVPDGEKTTVTLYKRGKAVKSATVKRYKGDEYSIADAADYAVQKLFEKKKEKKFEVGARVVAIKGNCGNERIVGEKGTIIKNSGEKVLGVEFDNYVDGHNCFDGVGKSGESGHCWWCLKEDLKLL